MTAHDSPWKRQDRHDRVFHLHPLAVDNLLTAEENLLLMADLHHLDRREGRRRAAELLRRFDLTEAARKPVVTFSGGMRRKLDLAMTLVGDPRIIFLDEPTTGLDAATDLFGVAAPDREALALQVPSDGGVPTLRAVLAVLDDAAIEPEGLTVHIPDLDDVFLTLTGHSGSGHSGSGERAGTAAKESIR